LTHGSFIRSEVVARYTPLHRGDVVFALSGEKIDDIGASAEILLDGEVVGGGDMAILRPVRHVASGFLGYALRAAPSAIQKAREGTGTTVKHTSVSSLRGVLVAIPPPDEQEAIVRFLDHANRRIDQFIRSKKKLIALLNEQKQAIIHRAVTRGLDPSVKLKDSGVPWLGQIPAHWESSRFKRVCSLLRDGTHLPPPRTATGYPLLSVRNVIGGQLVRRDDDSFISESDFTQLCRSFEVLAGDVVLAIVGATLGKVAVVADIGPFHIQRSLAVFRSLSHCLDAEYLAAFIRSPGFQQNLWRSVAFSAQPGIYLGFLADVPIVLPPLTEQRETMAALARLLAPVDRALAKTECEISLIRDYRTRLVADVVTGQLDVRAAAASLPAVEPEADLTDTEGDEVDPDDGEAA
jgi:type I restriction enzyme S subunit